MKEFNYTPTREQLEDKSFWDNYPPEGAYFNAYFHAPSYSVMRNDEKVKFITDDGKNLINAWPYQAAIKQAEYLSKTEDNITVKITGWSKSLIHKDRELETA